MPLPVTATICHPTPPPGPVDYLITPEGNYRIEKFPDGVIQVKAPEGKEHTVNHLATLFLQLFPGRFESIGGPRGYLTFRPKPLCPPAQKPDPSA